MGSGTARSRRSRSAFPWARSPAASIRRASRRRSTPARSRTWPRRRRSIAWRAGPGGAEARPDRQVLVHRRADGRGDARVPRGNAGRRAVQHVRQHGGRRDPRGLPRLRGLHRASRRAGLGGAGPGGCRRGRSGRARRARHRRGGRGAPARGVVRREGPRLDGRGRLRAPRGPLRRCHHLRGLDDERGRDRAGAAAPPRRSRRRRDRGDRRLARPDSEGLRRCRARGRRLRARDPGVGEDTAEPPRVSAGGAGGRRAAAHAGGQGGSARAARAGGLVTFPTITDEGLASLRARVGKDVPRPEPYIEVATRDAIRHWAHGIGDRNPYWATARVAPPPILFAMDRVVSGYVGGLPGIHAMYGGTEFRWQRPIREGDRLVGRSVLQPLEEKLSKFPGRPIKQTYRTTFVHDAGAVAAEADSWCFRTERDTARELRRYAPAEPHRYRDAEIARIRDAYRDEAIRGMTPRYWESVTTGETLPEVVKGPLTVTSIIAFVQGWGSLYVRAHGLAFDLFERHPALAIPNAFAVPEPPERVHWDEAFARAVGVPGAYDYGPERVARAGHADGAGER